MPNIDPITLTFVDSLVVRLSSESGAIIYYTLNGTEPDSTSTVYTKSILLKETTTIKVMAIKKNCVASNVRTRTISKILNRTNKLQGVLRKNTSLKVAKLNNAKSTVVIGYNLAMPEKVTITINDLSGRIISMVLNNNCREGAHSVICNIPNLPGGVYIVKMLTSSGIWTKPFAFVR